MTVWEKATAVFQEKELPQRLIFGPLSILCTLALAGLPFERWDLLIIGAVGLYLSARWHLRGLVYALVLLIVCSLVHHLIFPAAHFWQIGLEISMAFAFFITALSFEQNATEITSLDAQLQAKEAAIRNLEEDLSKEKEENAAQQISSQEKIATLQKELEELQAEQSSLFVLNDVLRKTSARHLEEKGVAETKTTDANQQWAILQQELAEARKEIQRISNENQLAQENQQLFAELNAARLEKEQTKQINETLVRLHAREALKAKKAEEEVPPLRQERDFLKERLAAAEFELQNAHARREQLDIEQKGKVSSAEELSEAQRKVQELQQVELLYKQLRKQFDEKNEILSQTRAQLFETETALQALRIEQEQKEPSFPEEVAKEIEKLEEEIATLHVENRELLELVSSLQKSKKKD